MCNRTLLASCVRAGRAGELKSFTGSAAQLHGSALSASSLPVQPQDLIVYDRYAWAGGMTCIFVSVRQACQRDVTSAHRPELHMQYLRSVLLPHTAWHMPGWVWAAGTMASCWPLLGITTLLQDGLCMTILFRAWSSCP